MTNPAGVTCSIGAALAQIGEKWSLLILREAMMGTTRFDAFQAHLGIARNILTDRLARLVAEGVLAREASPDNARIHHYRLTPKGSEVLPVLVALMHWGDRWVNAGIGPPIVMQDRATGREVRRMDLADGDGRPLSAAEVMIVPGPGATPVMRQRLGG